MISKLSAKYQFFAIHTADNTDRKVTSVHRLSAVYEKVHRLDPPTIVGVVLICFQMHVYDVNSP